MMGNYANTKRNGIDTISKLRLVKDYILALESVSLGP